MKTDRTVRSFAFAVAFAGACCVGLIACNKKKDRAKPHLAESSPTTDEATEREGDSCPDKTTQKEGEREDPEGAMMTITKWCVMEDGTLHGPASLIGFTETITGSYFRGKRHGTWTIFREDGSKLSTDEYRQGVLDGKSQMFSESGKLFREENLLNGQPHGVFKAWHSNGQLNLEGQYEHGERVGVFACWNIAGEKVWDSTSNERPSMVDCGAFPN